MKLESLPALEAESEFVSAESSPEHPTIINREDKSIIVETIFYIITYLLIFQ